MTREEARRLLSGYATGSLTELEKQLLFDAALDDQELFDELADEQTVKELVELPGAKRRLLLALGPERKQFSWWPWAVGAAVAATIAVGVWLARPGASVDEVGLVARVETPAPIVIPTPQPEVAPPAEVQARKTEPTIETGKAEVATDEPQQEADASPAPETLASAAKGKAFLRDDVAPVPAQLETRARQQRPTLAPPPPAKPAFPPQQGFLAGASPPPPPPAAPKAVAAEVAATITPGGSLIYEVRNTGILRMTPSRTGVLEVTFDGRPLYPSRAVDGGVTIDVSIPLEAKQLRLDFAAEPNAPGVAPQNGGVAGTLVLPAGPNARAVLVIPAQR